MTFRSLPVLEELKKLFKPRVSFGNIYLVCVQHLLETTGSMFEALIDIGFHPGNIFVKGKPYSTNPAVQLNLLKMGIQVYLSETQSGYGHLRENHKKGVIAMWRSVSSRLLKHDIIIVIDDGGLAIRHIPPDVIHDDYYCYGIEQTTSGLRYQPGRREIPIIQVATSAAKTKLEPILISRALNSKLHDLLLRIKPSIIGIVGYGNIGRALADFFSTIYRVMVFDIREIHVQKKSNDILIADSLELLIHECDVIIGATGVDISVQVDWESIVNRDKTLISVSSYDIEFGTLLRQQNSNNSGSTSIDLLSDLIVKLKNGCILNLIRGGTVANFDNSKESCPALEIQLTRGLLFSSIIQILNAHLSKSEELNGPTKLDSGLQRLVVETWFTNYPRFKELYPAELINSFKDKEWVENNS